MTMRQSHTKLEFYHLLPYGPIVHDNGVQFVVFSRNATVIRILLYRNVSDLEPYKIITLDTHSDRWGDVWSYFVPGLKAGQLYHIQADGPFEPENGHRFDPTARLVDPYAHALAGDFQSSSDGISRPPKCVIVDDRFDWGGDRHLRHDLSETVIYEMHVRGFTQREKEENPRAGTYLGIIDKIPYLQSLGVTAVELMPIHEFPTNHHDGTFPERQNYWGYDSLNFFSPHRGYAFDQSPGGQVREFKTMVKALHEAGIEVILDVVYNHTCEGNHLGPTLSFKGLENSVYYMLENDRQYYRNYSGCGNTVNGNHPVVREMIFHSLRHWVHNYHIDGFRFDLASILSRDRSGELVPNPPLVEMIGEDPMLSDTKIIAEAWDAAGAYQVGSFGDERWAEWNGRYRDDVRRYWRGDPHTQGAIATRLSGSSDLYQQSGRPPFCSINFITSHDGFTMNDLVSYNDKHNLANGEENRDGENNNNSYNYGDEGETSSIEINQIRSRQIKNMLTTLMLSQGVPMLVAGDECRRTQQGNNNAYCQDNEISWFDWDLVEKNAEFVRFTRELIRFRRCQPTVRRREYLTGKPQADSQTPDVSWYDSLGSPMNWHGNRTPLVCWLVAPSVRRLGEHSGRDILMLLNPLAEQREFDLTKKTTKKNWRLFVDTSAPSPGDIFPKLDGPQIPSHSTVILRPRTMMVYVETIR